MAQCHSWRCYNVVPTLHWWTNPRWPNVICWRANVSYDVGPMSVPHFSVSWAVVSDLSLNRWTPPAHFLGCYLFSPAVGTATIPPGPRERTSQLLCVYSGCIHVIPVFVQELLIMKKLDYPSQYCLWLFSIPSLSVVIRCRNSTLILKIDAWFLRYGVLDKTVYPLYTHPESLLNYTSRHFQQLHLTRISYHVGSICNQQATSNDAKHSSGNTHVVSLNLW